MPPQHLPQNAGNVAVLGSTGSIGQQALSVIRDNAGAFRVISLSAGENTALLAEQVREFKPRYVAVSSGDGADRLRREVGPGVAIRFGEEAAAEAGVLSEVHTVVAAISGFACLRPVLAAIDAGKHIALADKESLVAAGKLVREQSRKSGAMVVPVDSEHSSIFQCLLGQDNRMVSKIVLTASGGPFFRADNADFGAIRPEEAVRHPKWNMGAKISVDSATLMNKGLEVIEAAMLFDLRAEQIEVLVHPQTIVHGLVEFTDQTVLAALFETDMRVPIAFALSFLGSRNGDFSRSTEEAQQEFFGPLRPGAAKLDLIRAGPLEFFVPDREKFPCLDLCYQALRLGGVFPCFLNAANEVAVQEFLRECIRFSDIPRVVAGVLEKASEIEEFTLEAVFRADAWARREASNIVQASAAEFLPPWRARGSEHSGSST